MKHLLPPLPYDYAALEPHIDARTMKLHHDKHHAGYVANLNAALENFPALHERTATWLLLNLSEVPTAARTAVHHNAGGHVNHSLFWRAMSPADIVDQHWDIATASLIEIWIDETERRTWFLFEASRRGDPTGH